MGRLGITRVPSRAQPWMRVGMCAFMPSYQPKYRLAIPLLRQFYHIDAAERASGRAQSNP
jgi:hypothetical protein